MLRRKRPILVLSVRFRSFASHVLVNNVEELLFDACVGEIVDISLGDNDDINGFDEAIRVFPEDFADPPLDPIALNRIPNLA